MSEPSSASAFSAANPLPLVIKDRAVLYAAYMPFVLNGGLFIPTNRVCRMGEDVFLMLELMDDSERFPVSGKIIWITPRGAQDNRASGIGIQFSDRDVLVRNKIETYLAGVLKSERPTHTM